MLSSRKYWIVTAFLLPAAAGWAQTDPYNPYGANPYAPPAWATPMPQQPGFAPAPGTPAAPGTAPYPDNSYFAPVQPSTPPSFDYFQDEDEAYEPSYGATPGASGPREIKDSFKFVEEAPAPGCKEWGSSLLGPARFSDRSSCEFELAQKVDRGLSSIDDSYDRFETYKLRKVIKHEIPSRQEAQKYELKFDSLRSILKQASKDGCTCKDD